MKRRSINPHDPSDIVDEFETADANAVNVALKKATESFPTWRNDVAVVRGQALAGIAKELEKREDETAELVVREVGKPIREARAEVTRAIAIFRYFSQIILVPDGETYPPIDGNGWLIARRFPLGVCVLITPWNFPLAIPTWKLAPALAYGNSVVLKPASSATAVGRLLEEVVSKHVPEGVFQVIAGGGETAGFLLDHPDVIAVSFTGSLDVGRMVAHRAVRRGVRFQCEMGGQNPSLVFADADLDRAAAIITYAAMGCAGQKCTATSRIIVEEAVYEDMRDRLVAAVEKCEVIDPTREACVVGPMIDDSARASAMHALERGGGRILTGGQPLDVEGFYLAPTLVEVSNSASPLARDEVFAPVTAILKATSSDDALRLANDVNYGLVAAAFTSDLARAMSLASALEAGLVRINAPTSGVDFHVPFGGSKASSLGPREQGLSARDFYTETRTLLINP